MNFGKVKRMMERTTLGSPSGYSISFLRQSYQISCDNICATLLCVTLLFDKWGSEGQTMARTDFKNKGKEETYFEKSVETRSRLVKLTLRISDHQRKS